MQSDSLNGLECPAQDMGFENAGRGVAVADMTLKDGCRAASSRLCFPKRPNAAVLSAMNKMNHIPVISRGFGPTSSEWVLLYRKYYNDEAKKLRI
jgi:hypothetical protein